MKRTLLTVLLAALLCLSACERLPEPASTPEPTQAVQTAAPDATPLPASAVTAAVDRPTPEPIAQERVYVPDPDMDTEIGAMKTRMHEAAMKAWGMEGWPQEEFFQMQDPYFLQELGLDEPSPSMYVYEEKPMLILPDGEHEVVWLYARCIMNGHWGDIVFTRDKAAIDYLKAHREFFLDLRREAIEAKRARQLEDQVGEMIESALPPYDQAWFQGLSDEEKQKFGDERIALRQEITAQVLEREADRIVPIETDNITHCLVVNAGEYWIYFEGCGSVFFDCGFTDQDLQIYEYTWETRKIAHYLSRSQMQSPTGGAMGCTPLE